MSGGDSRSGLVSGTPTCGLSRGLAFSEHGIQLGVSGEQSSQEMKVEAARLLLTFPLKSLVTSFLLYFIGFIPVAKANADSRAGKSGSVSGWGVARSHCRGACGIGNIFTISFGKHNLLRVHVVKCMFAAFIMTCFCLNVNIFDAINIACLLFCLVIFI